MTRKMTSHRVTFRRTIGIALLAILAVGATTLLPTPHTEALEGPGGTCPDGEQQVHEVEWLLTPEAIARTINGDCPNSLKPTCRQECQIYCGTSYPQSNFGCFAF